MTSYQQNQMDFMRVWLSGSGDKWVAVDFLGIQFPRARMLICLEQASTLPTPITAARYPCGWTMQTPVFMPISGREACRLNPTQQYQVTARVKVSGVSGPAAAGGDYGFVIKQGGWLGTDCVKTGTGTRITAPVTGSTGWITVTGSYTTGANDSWLGNLYLTRENASGGQIYIDEVHMYRANDPAQVEFCASRMPTPSSTLTAMGAAQWDLYIQSAEAHGVYLKLVIDEKNEWIRNHMGADGKMTADRQQ